MYSLGSTFLLPEDFERILAERDRKAEAAATAAAPKPGDPELPYILETITVDVDRVERAAFPPWLALGLLATLLAASNV